MTITKIMMIKMKKTMIKMMIKKMIMMLIEMMIVIDKPARLRFRDECGNPLRAGAENVEALKSVF